MKTALSIEYNWARLSTEFWGLSIDTEMDLHNGRTSKTPPRFHLEGLMGEGFISRLHMKCFALILKPERSRWSLDMFSRLHG